MEVASLARSEVLKIAYDEWASLATMEGKSVLARALCGRYVSLFDLLCCKPSHTDNS